MTLSEKLWDSHVVRHEDGGLDQLYVDLHLVHEVSSPQAFDGLRLTDRRVRRPDLTLATEDHDVPTDGLGLRDPLGRAQIEALRRNCAEFGVPLHQQGSVSQGIVHVIGPELGLTQPGMLIACGDSHTSTHGAFGSLGIGIGTSEVEHVLATQTLLLPRPRTCAVNVTGTLPLGSGAKDLVLALIALVGMGGGQGHIAEYRGQGVRALSMEARMTLCNMSVEWSARAGVVAPDDVTAAYVHGRRHAATGPNWDRALAAWSELSTDSGAVFDREVTLDATGITPQVTWGTNPSQAVPLSAAVPDPASLPAGEQDAARRALTYMALEVGTPMRDITVDAVFIGSCTNGRLEDLRSAAEVFRGRRVATGVRVLVVPGSARVKAAAEREGLDRVFEAAGAQWRDPGCSMCLGMNSDVLEPGLRSASTSNRNFEGRQGPHARTHLVSPAVAAATAVAGRLSAPADLS